MRVTGNEYYSGSRQETTMKVTRKIIHIDEERCDGCGICIPSCAEGALQIRDGKARLVSDKYCDGLGACLGTCPRDAITIIEREANEFDQEAVEGHLRLQEQTPCEPAPAMPCGCPSTLIQSFVEEDPCKEANHPVVQDTTQSSLTHWPVQIRLVPPKAPFLKGADLLITADCTPVAYPRFHELLKGKVVLVGCPKFDDIAAYTEKFVHIFKANDIGSITVVVMEVPCCQGLPRALSTALSTAGKDIPLEVRVISTRGEIMDTTHTHTAADTGILAIESR
jgi:ferredoxin